MGRLDLGSRILPYTCIEISRRCQKKEDPGARILVCNKAGKQRNPVWTLFRHPDGLWFIRAKSFKPKLLFNLAHLYPMSAAIGGTFGDPDPKNPFFEFGVDFVFLYGARKFENPRECSLGPFNPKSFTLWQVILPKT